MKVRVLLLVSVACAALFSACRCGEQINKVNPILAVSPTQVVFGQVKVGHFAEVVLKLESQSQAAVVFSSFTVKDGPLGGEAAAYTVVDPPESIGSLSEGALRLRFSPTALQAYEATLIIASNDPERESFEVPLGGEGAHPVMTLVPECKATLNCKGTVSTDPAAIDFGAEPFARQVPIPTTELPKINVINESNVDLVVTKLAIEGADAAAFTFDNFAAGLPAEGLTLAAGEGINLSVRFKPANETRMEDYVAQVVAQGDDPAHPQLTVALKGVLGPNLPPIVCANIVKVKPGDGSPQKSYDAKEDWDLLLVAPASGYDFTMNRDIQPKSLVTFSASSDPGNARACTTDPEDQRMGLTYLWTITQWPTGSKQPVLGGAQTPSPSFTPVASGAYEVTLAVKDAQGHQTTTTLKFVAVLKEDLVVQLSWGGDDGAYAGVDLDVHLVRPSSTTPADDFGGVYSFFEEGPNAETSGDMNGFSFGYQQANKASGVNFDWGTSGVFDDPRLNVDDKGGGQLIENVSLNYPENDAQCATSACAYKIVVHYFNDARVAPAPEACVVGGTCRDGEGCTCTGAEERCVASTAGVAAPATGVGKCFAAPEPVVRIFFKGNPTPAAVIPLEGLMPADDLKLGAPCHALYVADVLWPSKAELASDGGVGADGGQAASPTVVIKGADAQGRITAPSVARFGVRQAGSLQCSPNTTRAGSAQDNWYQQEPL